MEERTKHVVVLDGGTGMALAEMGHSFINGDSLWSAAVVYTHPQDLVKLHKNFFLAGADLVITASYQASVEGYKKRFGLSDTEAVKMITRGVELAKTARDEVEQQTGRHGFVAASVGPYGATLCDRSEYHGRYTDSMTREELSVWHLARLTTLVEAQPDLLAIETIPAVKEAEAIVDCLKHFPEVKASVTYQCKDGNSTAHGESIQDAIRSVVAHDSVVAVGINCVHPDFVTPLLHNISELTTKVPIIVKPNGGMFDHDGRSTTKQKLSDRVPEWLEAGATWIGGCCYIYPSDITDIRTTLGHIPGVKFLQDKKNLV